MSYDQYIQNPMGIKNAVISKREMYREMYTKKWDELKVRENGKIDYMLLKSESDYYIYMKIPSEVVPQFYYDVVVRFMPPSDKKAAVIDRTLKDYNVQFFSNDPSFVFTFAHAFARNDMIIKDLNLRMSKLALKRKAEERNPSDQVGYVKSLYFAYLEIKQKGLLSKVTYASAKKYDKQFLISMIMPADEKIDRREKEEEKIRQKKKRVENQTKPKVIHHNTTEDKTKINVNSNIHTISPKSKITGRPKITGKSKITGKR